ncbi:hypothetical protein MAIT1_04296 [Magnetofaba australis IT-1]|uniref:Uncharacterized protein n=1 Tax=Magnetofaba australis IT-1 TaxID=1434232 RepID=A0A1Y2K7F3_9PROT|nr:hypothetical protein MAIT1_04296 [Magnetofaba australis IT-1]
MITENKTSQQVAQHGRQAFYELMPDAPSESDMKRFIDESRSVARNIYQQNPVRQFPDSSRVQAAYEAAKDGFSPYESSQSLTEAYA